jgi:hypothetical protein
MPTKLRVIPGVGPEDIFGLQPGDVAGSAPALGSNLGHPLLRRPGDHVETLWLADPSVLADLRAAICKRRLHPDTGVAIALERRLAVEGLGSSSLVAILNELSSVEVPEIELWSAHSAYLSHLLHGFADPPRSAQSASNGSRRVSVPIRLIDRLAVALPPPFEGVEDEIENSVRWEVAALLRSETLSEWAYRSALDCLSAATT